MLWFGARIRCGPQTEYRNHPIQRCGNNVAMISLGQNGREMAPRRLQDGPKMAEDGSQMALEWAHHRTKDMAMIIALISSVQDGPKVTPRWPQDRPGWLLD